MPFGQLPAPTALFLQQWLLRELLLAIVVDNLRQLMGLSAAFLRAMLAPLLAIARHRSAAVGAARQVAW